jgi:Mg2+/Co2+ transporter CorC
LGSEFESEDFDTIGGLVFGHLGRTPEVGDELVVRERGEEDTSGEQSRR